MMDFHPHQQLNRKGSIYLVQKHWSFNFVLESTVFYYYGYLIIGMTFMLQEQED